MRRIASGGLVALVLLLAISWMLHAPTSEEQAAESLSSRASQAFVDPPQDTAGNSRPPLAGDGESAPDAGAGETRGSSGPGVTAERSEDILRRTSRARRPPKRRSEPPGTFDTALLEEQGVEPERIRGLEQIWNEHQTLRPGPGEGESEPDVGARASQDLESSLCPALEAAECDEILYATGHRNRVVVANVADGSLASQFGLRAGDEIVAIAGERVFSIFEIQPRLSAAAAGTTTIIQFVRYGQVMQISVPGGQKLGAPLTAQTRAPLD